MIRALISIVLFCVWSQAQAQVVAVCETLVSGDPFLSKRIKQDYERSSQLALEDFLRDYPGSKLRLKLCLETESTEVILGKTIGPEIAAIVGFSFASSSKIAADIANKNKMSYFSPTSSLDELYLGSYAKSLGISAAQTGVVASRWLADQVPWQEIHVYSPFDKAYSRMQQRALTRQFNQPFISHNYMQVDSDTQALPKTANSQGQNLIVFTGYAFQHFNMLMKMIRNRLPAVYLTTNQWAYNQDLLRSMIEMDDGIQLYTISDFGDPTAESAHFGIPQDLESFFSLSRTKAQRFVKNFSARFSVAPEPFAFAIYDAVYAGLVFSEMRDSFEKTKANPNPSLRWFSGVSGPFFVRGGVFGRPSYLLKWAHKKFEVVRVYL